MTALPSNPACQDKKTRGTIRRQLDPVRVIPAYCSMRNGLTNICTQQNRVVPLPPLAQPRVQETHPDTRVDMPPRIQPQVQQTHLETRVDIPPPIPHRGHRILLVREAPPECRFDLSNSVGKITFPTTRSPRSPAPGVQSVNSIRPTRARHNCGISSATNRMGHRVCMFYRTRDLRFNPLTWSSTSSPNSLTSTHRVHTRLVAGTVQRCSNKDQRRWYSPQLRNLSSSARVHCNDEPPIAHGEQDLVEELTDKSGIPRSKATVSVALKRPRPMAAVQSRRREWALGLYADFPPEVYKMHLTG